MREILGLTRDELRNDRHIYTAIIFYLVVANAILAPFRHIFPRIYAEYFLSLASLDGVVFPAFVIVGVLLRSLFANPRDPLAWFRARLHSRCIARILAGYGLLLALVPFMATFTAMKSFIGLNGFTADTPLADFDRWLHLGVDPAIFLHRILDYGSVWRFFAFFYGPGWLLWVNGVIFWMAIAAPSPGLRKRFFFAYIFAWVVLGNAIAWLAISAGPAFFAEVTGNADRFASVLATVSAYTLPDGTGIRSIQMYLWDLYISRSSDFGMGISAFPSLHVAMVMLCALAALEINRGLAVIGVFIVIIIQTGSVLFGWHYAIDGYFSIAVMTVFWLILRHPSLLGRPSIDQPRVAQHPFADYSGADRV